MPHTCGYCGRVESTAKGLKQHIADTHERPKIERILGSKVPEPPMFRSNNPPAVVAELTSKEVAWLLGTTELQMTAGMQLLQAVHDDKLNPTRKTLEQVVDDIETVRSIRKKLQP